MLNKTLHIDFKNYWHAGSGRSSGYHLDAVCQRDANKLPYLPGRQLKGILRHAVRRAENWGWYDGISLPKGPVTLYEHLLFGSTSQDEQRNQTFSGLLQVDSATLPETEYLYLSHQLQASLVNHLFDELFTTAIDEKTGTAKQYSLRGLEVCLPLTLQSVLQLQLTALQPDLRSQQEVWLKSAQPWQVIEIALPLIDALGAQRNRGLGEAILSLK